MRSGGCVLLTAIKAISLGLRPARLAAAAIRSWIDARLAAIVMKKGEARNKSFAVRSCGHDCPQHARNARKHNHYIIAVGGAGSLGSPALVSGSKIMRAASRAITATPTR